MKYRPLGRAGVQVSEVSLGTMAFGRWIDERASAAVLDVALASGINLIDTADVYGTGMDNGDVNQLGESEEILGRSLKERRQGILLATKSHNRTGPGINDQGQSRYHIYRALENSLVRLQTDYIDLYQVHRFDELTPLEETLEALTDLVRQGKVRYIGRSNYAAWRLAKAHGISALHGLRRFESVQPEYSLITRDIERELIPFAQSEHVGVIVYSPLGRGILSGKYRAGKLPIGLAPCRRRTETAIAAEPAACAFHRRRDPAFGRAAEWTLPQFALNWVLSRRASRQPLSEHPGRSTLQIPWNTRMSG